MNGTSEAKELHKFSKMIDHFSVLVDTVDNYRGWNGNRHGLIEMLTKMEKILRGRRIHELARKNYKA